MSCCKKKELKLVYERMCVATNALLKKPLPPPSTVRSNLSQPDGNILSLEVKQIHKRREPNKHYIYELVVAWSSGANLHIFRRYSNFFEFQVQLCAQQSLLVGLGSSIQVTNTVIPSLPCRAFIGRSNVKQVAQKRKERLEEFCESIMKLPEELIRSDIFTRFFSLWPDDTAVAPSSDSAQPGEDDLELECTEFIAIADYDPTNMHQISVTAGTKLQVLERRLSGWWLCVAENEQGYLPASILQPLDGSHDNEKVENFSCKQYIVNADFTTNNSDELSLKKGQTVQVVFKSYDGWWRVKCGSETGIVPSLYLTESEHQQRKETLERSTKKELYVTPSNNFNPPPRRGTFRRHDIVSMYSVLEEVPQDFTKKSSVKYALINKSKNEKKNTKVNAEVEEIIHKMLDINIEENPDISINYELSDELVKGLQLTQSLQNSQLPTKHVKPPKPPRKYVNPQEVSSLLQRSPSTPSFVVDNSIYQNYERASHTNILSRPFDSSDRSLLMNNNKCSASKDDEEIDYINWMPSIDPINVDEVNENTADSPFPLKTRQHLSLRVSSSLPQKTLPKMFVAIEQYTAQNEACVSFTAGDNATLIERSEDAVWSFVRVNGEEGWSPSEYWKPIALKKPGKAPPPSIKPTRLTKAVTPTEAPSPALRRLSTHENKLLPVPPARNMSKAAPSNGSAPPQPVSLKPFVEQPEVPYRTKSPMTVLATPSQPAPREGAKAKEDTVQFLWGKMTRKFCEDLLLQRAKQGEFIFRESTNREGELVLSMRYHYRVHHFNIKQEDNWYCIGENFRVRTLSEIIVHFQKTPIASYKEHGDKLIDVFLSRPLNKNP